MVDDRVRHRLVVSGVVQGVGFRPFVYALASKFGLSGSVGNDSTRVVDMPLGEQLPRIC